MDPILNLLLNQGTRYRPYLQLKLIGVGYFFPAISVSLFIESIFLYAFDITYNCYMQNYYMIYLRCLLVPLMIFTSPTWTWIIFCDRRGVIVWWISRPSPSSVETASSVNIPSVIMIIAVIFTSGRFYICIIFRRRGYDGVWKTVCLTVVCKYYIVAWRDIWIISFFIHCRYQRW